MPPKDLRIRPTADRVKESIFNILTTLTGNFAGCRVLDVFAGTGNLGIEALSRGAAYVLFVDNHKASTALITGNLKITGFEDRSRVVNREALAALHAETKREAPFQLVFLDPPYRQGLSASTLEFLADSALLDDRSIVVAEFSIHEELPCCFGKLHEFDRRIYGDTAVSFFCLVQNSE